jgi:hypothetical protein
MGRVAAAKTTTRRPATPSVAKLAAAFLEEAEWAFAGFLPYGPQPPTRRTWSSVQVLPAEPFEEHYELQLMRGPTGGLRIEVGFHAEHRSADMNDAVLARLLGREKAWRTALGQAPEAGPFLGRPRPWRRLSETWDDTLGFDSGVAIEAAERLAAYVKALEPIRTR